MSIYPAAGMDVDGASASRLHAAVPDEILVFGGWTGDEVSGDVLAIDPATLQVSMRQQGPKAEEIAALEQKAKENGAPAPAAAAAADDAAMSNPSTRNSSEAPKYVGPARINAHAFLLISLLFYAIIYLI